MQVFFISTHFAIENLDLSVHFVVSSIHFVAKKSFFHIYFDIDTIN